MKTVKYVVQKISHVPCMPKRDVFISEDQEMANCKFLYFVKQFPKRNYRIIKRTEEIIK